MDRTIDQRTLGELLSELSRETTTLIRQEVALARSELRRNLARVGRHTALIAGGAALAYAGLLGIVAGLVLLLVRVGLSPWLAALLGGGSILVVGYVLMQQGLTALQRDQITPEATVDNLKESAEWAKNQLR
jgi:Putative Actinobacterial Holin-X, holin superfamily III